MWLDCSNLQISLDAMIPGEDALLRREIASNLGIGKGKVRSAKVKRRSIDARKRSNVHFVVRAVVDVDDEAAGHIHCKKGVVTNPCDGRASLPPAFHSEDTIERTSDLSSSEGFLRPIVVGSGPCGLFCALSLAEAGLRPKVIERGQDVDSRIESVEMFLETRVLDPQSNLQFGEGGAGTFSDGKLNTSTKSRDYKLILQTMVDVGAPESILVDGMPHVGTDYLVNVVKGIRKRIEELGGDVLFSTKLESISLAEDEGVRKVESIRVSDVETGKEQTMPCNRLILACGHSARDTFKMLYELDVRMVRKPFAVGVRAEHLQSKVDIAQFGKFAGHPALGAARYKLSTHLKDGRGVYTFCMCPGGVVVAAASEEGGVCVNGMSTYARDGRNANSALLVEVRPDDFEGNDPLAGVEFQRKLERDCFDVAYAITKMPYSAPASRVDRFLAADGASEADESAHYPSMEDACQDPGIVEPTYPLGVAWTDLRKCLPGFVCDSLKEALPVFDRKLPGFADPDTILTAVEARSSSPIRMERDSEELHSIGIKGLYPAGEGAGHAGGIMSSAADGIRVSRAVIKSLLRDARTPETSLDDAIGRASRTLREGGIAAIPTDTVWGIGVSSSNPEGARQLFDAKGRDASKPIAWLISDGEELERYGRDVPKSALQLASAFWPGALTIVVKASPSLPSRFLTSSKTIGLRCPDSKIARRLISEVGCPLAVTSANPSGKRSADSLDDLDVAWLEKVGADLSLATDAITKDLAHASQASSTVVDCTGDDVVILREGPITKEMMDKVISPCAAILNR